MLSVVPCAAPTPPVLLPPQPHSTGEQKSKPTQNSVRQLRGQGLSPDLVGQLWRGMGEGGVCLCGGCGYCRYVPQISDNIC